MARKILAVDDEPSIVRLVTAALNARGYEVVAAANGEEALEMVAREKPDLIVCDIMMPKMDGREVARRLAADPATKGIPLIFLSAIGDIKDQLSTLDEGGQEYLTKPFNPSELGDYVDAMLDPSRKGEIEKLRRQHVGKLRAMTEIMQRRRG
ncbi:MAG: response regulator [Actinobacteria bacterium]|nr:response regulator [Actinomycetota bacterium]